MDHLLSSEYNLILSYKISVHFKNKSNDDSFIFTHKSIIGRFLLSFERAISPVKIFKILAEIVLCKLNIINLSGC